MKSQFVISTELKAKPLEVYEAWLNSETHSEMTGGEAVCGNMEGDKFSAWDGYIEGVNLELNPGKFIKQSWRTSDFRTGDDDSILELSLNGTDYGTEITLKHYNIPKNQSDYERGWKEHYFEPMERYFDS